MADRHTHGPYAISAPRAESQSLSRPSKMTTSTSFEFGNSNIRSRGRPPRADTLAQAAIRAVMPMSDRVMGQTVGMDREGRQDLHYRALEGDISGIRDRLAAGDEIAALFPEMH